MANIQIFDKKTILELENKIKEVRKDLLNDREKFWQTNQNAFEKNVELLIGKANTPKGWGIYTLASSLINNTEIMPYDYDSWSTVLIIVATEKQGHELLLFYNKARSGFLSLPGLVPIITHELSHTHQAANSPKKYSNASFNDSSAKAFETDAEKSIYDLPNIFLQEAVLESVLFCFDKKGWNSAQKMIDFLYKDRVNLYSSGYLPWLTEKDYQIFLNARKKKDISHFIKYFIDLT